MGRMRRINGGEGWGKLEGKEEKKANDDKEDNMSSRKRR